MKKLLPLILVLWFGAMKAQDLRLQNSIAVAAGPNWQFPIFDLRLAENGSTPRIGYSLGLDYTLKVAKHWHVTAGFRYNFLSYKTSTAYLVNPPFPTYNETARHWQYLAGIRWLSKPHTWRFYADGELGLSDLREPEGSPNQKLQPTISVGFGMAWQKAGSKLAVFVEPTARYVFPHADIVVFYGSSSRFFMLAFETGVRRYF